MNSIVGYGVGAIRLTTGSLLVLIGMQPLTRPDIQNPDTIYPFILASTGLLALDILVRILFLSVGIVIMLGIRARLLAAFMLSITLLEAIQCLDVYKNMHIGHSLLMVLLVGLAILVASGGGKGAMRPGGWKNIPL